MRNSVLILLIFTLTLTAHADPSGENCPKWMAKIAHGAGEAIGTAAVLGVVGGVIVLAGRGLGIRSNGFNRKGKVVKNNCSSHSSGTSYTPQYNGPMQSNGTNAFSGVESHSGGSYTTCIVSVEVEGENVQEDVELSVGQAMKYPVGSTYHFTWLYHKGP